MTIAYDHRLDRWPTGGAKVLADLEAACPGPVAPRAGDDFLPLPCRVLPSNGRPELLMFQPQPTRDSRHDGAFSPALGRDRSDGRAPASGSRLERTSSSPPVIRKDSKRRPGDLGDRRQSVWAVPTNVGQSDDLKRLVESAIRRQGNDRHPRQQCGDRGFSPLRRIGPRADRRDDPRQSHRRRSCSLGSSCRTCSVARRGGGGDTW